MRRCEQRSRRHLMAVIHVRFVMPSTLEKIPKKSLIFHQ